MPNNQRRSYLYTFPPFPTKKSSRWNHNKNNLLKQINRSNCLVIIKYGVFFPPFSKLFIYKIGQGHRKVIGLKVTWTVKSQGPICEHEQKLLMNKIVVHPSHVKHPAQCSQSFSGSWSRSKLKFQNEQFMDYFPFQKAWFAYTLTW